MPVTTANHAINRENFDSIMKEYTIEPYCIYWHNEAEQELNIYSNFFTRRTLMQLVGECDRQGHDCYMTSGRPKLGSKSKSMFVITKNK